jgi:hypothetical protein
VNIHLKKIIRPTYFAWVFLFTTFLFFSLCIFIYIDKDRQARYAYAERSYIDEQIEINKIISENERYLKITEFYSSIMSTYFVKYREKDNRIDRGLNKYQKSELIYEVYHGCRILRIPYMYPMAKIIIESSGRPFIRTKWETGLWQMRHEYAMQAKYFYQFLPEHLKKRFAFVYTGKKEELENVINSTRIELINIWGYMRMFDGSVAWAYTASHWGMDKIHKIYKSGIKLDMCTFPKEYRFKVKNSEDDVRNPLMYYYLATAYASQFEKFSTKVYVDKGYIEAYRRQASRLEREYIDMLKFVSDTMKYIVEVKENQEKFESQQKKLKLKYEEKIKYVDDEYRKLQGLVKSGRFKSFKDIVRMARGHFRWLRDEIVKEKKELYYKFLIYVYVFIVCFILFFFVIGLIATIKKILSKLWLR